MKIQVSGTRYVEYTNKNNQVVKGIEVAGIIVEPDVVDQNVDGELVFQEYVSLQKLPELPNKGNIYTVNFNHWKASDGWRAVVVGFEED